MARVAYTVPQATPALAVIELALAPLQSEDRWSIELEAMGTGWHDSSWMLRRGLDVSELLSAEEIPPEWQWRSWVAADAPA